MLPSKFETIFVVGSVKDLEEFNLHWFVTQVLTKLYYFFNQPTHLIRAASLQILSKHLTSRVAGKTTSSLPSGFSSILLLSVAKLGIHKMVVVFVHKHIPFLTIIVKSWLSYEISHLLSHSLHVFRLNIFAGNDEILTRFIVETQTRKSLEIQKRNLYLSNEVARFACCNDFQAQKNTSDHEE